MSDKDTNQNKNTSSDNLPPYEQLEDDIANIELEYLTEDFNLANKSQKNRGILSFVIKKKKGDEM